MSLDGFFIAAPLLIMLIFIYLQLYLVRLQTLIGKLEQKYDKLLLYPWMFNIAKFPDSGFVGRVQTKVIGFIQSLTLPLCLTILAFGFVKKHEPFLSYVLTSMPFMGVLIVLVSHYYLLDNIKKQTLFTYYLKNRNRRFFICVLLLFQICLLVIIIPWINVGAPWYNHQNQFINHIRHLVNLNLGYQNLISVPNKDYKRIYWADFSGKHLQGANLHSTILERTDMRRVELQNAWLFDTMLEDANLNYAMLENAKLIDTDMKGADLVSAILNKSILRNADLRECDLQSAVFEQTELENVDLRGAKNITAQQLCKAKSLYKSMLDPTLLEEVNNTCPHVFKPVEYIYRGRTNNYLVFSKPDVEVTIKKDGRIFMEGGAGMILINMTDGGICGGITYWESSISPENLRLIKSALLRLQDQQCR
jgi:hypothetical protein